MLRVFSDFGYQVQRRYADGVVHLTFPIEPTPESPRFLKSVRGIGYRFDLETVTER